jgi:hypothetical protein
MESKADFGNAILIPTKEVQSYYNCSYREPKVNAQQPNLASEFIQHKAYIG